MPRYLIEIPHKNRKKECLQAITIFKSTGSHFLTNADWGCSDDVHKAWIIVDLDNKEEALNIVPPWYRQKALVITLDKLAFNNMDKDLDQHKD